MPNAFARHLRRNATDAERALWYELKEFTHEGVHFRRQVAIGKYIADFACFHPKVAVELDGGQHNEAINIEADLRRTRTLEGGGYRVLRFWNVDVFKNREGVVDMIRNAAGLPTTYDYRHLQVTPTPNPSPQGGGE